MRDFTGIGFVVSKISTLFPLWKQVNMQVGLKAWKIWEDRPENIENIPKNDIIVLEDDPVQETTVTALNAFVKGGGIVVYLFSLDEESGFVDMLVDGKLAGETFRTLLDGIVEDDLAARCKGLDVKIARDEGAVITLSKNVFTSEPDPEAGRGEERVENLDFFVNLMRYLGSLKAELNVKRVEAFKAPISKVAVMIHGESLWRDGKDTSIETIVRRAFAHLGLDALYPQVLKERLYRAIDPEQQDMFPEIYYYHCSFADDEDDARVHLADKYIDQAKAVHAVIRTERYWEQDATALFCLDLARYHTEAPGLARLYLVPPARIGTRTHETTSKLLSRCFLEPLAARGIESFILATGNPTGGITPCFPDIKKVKARTLDERNGLILLHGPELAAQIKDKPIPDFLAGLESGLPNGTEGEVLKILLHVTVNQLALQNRIKEMTFNLRKVEDKRRERLKKDIEREQEKLHAYTRIEKDKKTFENRGYTLIEVEDSIDADQDVKEFFVDQALPFILGHKIGRVHELLPANLETYFKSVASPLVPQENVSRIEIK